MAQNQQMHAHAQYTPPSDSKKITSVPNFQESDTQLGPDKVFFTSTMFGDLKSTAGVKSLNAFLSNRTYIDGFTPSQADTAVYAGLAEPPQSDRPHALRWYNHVKSFGEARKQFAKASAAVNTTENGAVPANIYGQDELREENDDALYLHNRRVKRLVRNYYKFQI